MTASSPIYINNVRVPRFIYGTAWKEEETANHVKTALNNGFTGIDTANQRIHYHEAAVGEALKECYQEELLSRQQLFLQTKFTYAQGQDHRLPYDPQADYTTQVNQSFTSSLEHLGTDYLDSYLLHGPNQRDGLSDADIEVWRSMEALYKSGQAKLIGVSNFNIHQLEKLYKQAEIKPAMVQNRCFAQLGWDINVREFCRQHSIQYQGFSLLTANTSILVHQAFMGIVAKTGLTPAQVIFQACMGMNMLLLTGTTDEQHMQQDLACDRVTLDKADIHLIETLLIP